MAERPWFTLTLRLSFARWSQAVDRDGLVAVRAWIAEASARIASNLPVNYGGYLDVLEKNNEGL